jgi:putative glutamine amidotransferase
MSNERPVVGMATQTLQPIPGQAPLSYVMGQQYVRVIATGGAVPCIIPLLADDERTLRAIFDRLDGLFLAGGVDIEPSGYGELRREWCGLTDPARDAVETKLLGWAADVELPVLGVCRGVQMINVAHGGTLMQDIAREKPDAAKHDYFPQQGFHDRALVAHPIRIESGTRLHALLGESASVNSLHHQGIKRLGAGLVSSAVAPDGVIEGVEGANGRFLVGVQWHPEELVDSDPSMKRVFEAFIDAANEYRQRRKGAESSDSSPRPSLQPGIR